ncbi:MAG: hypothetical protein WA673_10580 [Candidatus Acidiferrales bacterium]
MPVVTVVLLLVFGNYLATLSQIDPLSLAQNRRMRFQSSDSLEVNPSPEFTQVERKWADAVVRNGFTRESSRPAILYFGDSQTMALVDWRPGDLTAPQWLQIFLLRRLGEAHAPVVILGSQANLNMAEFLIELVSATQWNPPVIQTVIASLALKEWTRLGIRDTIAAEARAPEVRATLAALVASHPDLTDADAVLKPLVSSAPRSQASQVSNPRSVYNRFNDQIQRVADMLPLFSVRPYLYADLSVAYINARNWLLNIRTDTPRPVPAQAFRGSLELLEITLDYAQARKIPVVLYLAPVRNVEPNPNLPVDLEHFDKSVQAIAEEHNVVTLNYSNLVPDNLWIRSPDDSRDPDRDFAHFTGDAHKLVAQHLMSDIGGRLVDWKAGSP